MSEYENSIHEICALLWCYSAYSGNFLPTCGDNLSIPLEDGIDRLFRNVGKELPLLAAYYPRRAHTSSSSRRKPEITRRSYTCKGGMKVTHIDLTLSWFYNYRQKH